VASAKRVRRAAVVVAAFLSGVGPGAAAARAQAAGPPCDPATAPAARLVDSIDDGRESFPSQAIAGRVFGFSIEQHPDASATALDQYLVVRDVTGRVLFEGRHAILDEQLRVPLGRVTFEYSWTEYPPSYENRPACRRTGAAALEGVAGEAPWILATPTATGCIARACRVRAQAAAPAVATSPRRRPSRPSSLRGATA